MDWLKDKKNRPVVAAIVAGVIIVIGLVFFMMSRQSSTDGTMAGAETGMPAPGGTVSQPSSVSTGPPPSAPGVDSSGAPAGGAAGQAQASAASVPAGGAQQAANRPIESWRADPFLPVGYKPTKAVKKIKLKPPILDFPFYKFPTPKLGNKSAKDSTPEPSQPVRRMSGILLNGRVYAIIEANGQSQIVQPGDVLADRLAMVERIEADKVVLKTMSKRPRYLVVRMAAAPSGQNDNSQPANSPGGMPFGPPGVQRSPYAPANGGM